LTTPFMHSGNAYVGNYQANVSLQPDTTTGITFVGSAGHDEFHGGSGNDVFSGLGGNDTIIGGAGIDTATGYGASYHLAIQEGHWVVTNGSNTDQLTGVEEVVINGTTYLLGDQFGADGGFQHGQDAINAASGPATILIAPGTYTESGSDLIGHTVGLYINKPDLTLQGVDATGALITTVSAAAAVGATIISGHQTGFGANHWVDFGGDGTTIQGLHLQAGAETNNNLLEIWGAIVTVQSTFIDVHRGGTVDTGAAALFQRQRNDLERDQQLRGHRQHPQRGYRCRQWRRRPVNTPVRRHPAHHQQPLPRYVRLHDRRRALQRHCH